MPTVISGTTLNALTTVSWGVMSLFANNEQGVWFDPSDFLPKWRRNLFRYSEDFSNTSVWAKSGTATVTTGQTDPLGGTTAAKIEFASIFQWHGQNYTFSGGETVTHSLWLRGDTVGTITLTDASGGAWGKTVTISTSWQRFIVTATSVPAGGRIVAVLTGSGDLTTVYVAFEQLDFGSSVTAYQKITDGIQDYLTYQPQPVMFQNAAGTTPVTAVEQPIGLILDKSKGLALGSELVTNGTFDSGITGWTKGAGTTDPISWDSSGKRLIITNDIAYFGFASQTLSGLTVGKTYLVTGVISGSTVETRIQIAFLDAGTSLILPAGGGTARFVFAATSTSHSLVLQNTQSTLNGISYWDNISVRELPGNHARQSTDASRPVLSARVNLLTYSEDFSQGIWTTVGSSIVLSSIIPPTGVTTVQKLRVTTANAPHGKASPLLAVSAITYRASAVVRADEITWCMIGDTQNGGMYVNLSNGTQGSLAAGFTNPVITPLGDGWYRISIDFTGGANKALGLYAASGNNGVVFAGANNTDGFLVSAADLRLTNVGTNLPPYQRVGAATDYDTNGFPLYFRFDGVDDYLQASTYTMPLVERMTMIGMREISAVQYAGVLSVYPAAGNDYDSSTGYFFGGGDKTTASFHMEGILGQSAGGYNPLWTSNPSQIIPTSVITEDKTLGVGYLRANGIQVGFDSDFTEFSANSNGGLIIGHRWISNSAWSSFKFNGNIYGIILLGRRATGVELAATEAYINSKTKAY